jgi:hypothetical protein
MWALKVEPEFMLIRFAVKFHNIIAMDTEFLGTIVCPDDKY